MGGCEVAVAVHLEADFEVAAGLDGQVAGSSDVELEVVDVDQVHVLGGDRDLVLEVVGRVGEFDVAGGRGQRGRATDVELAALVDVELAGDVEFARDGR